MADRVRVRGVTIHRPIIYGNTATVLTPAERETSHYQDHTHRWTVAVRSAPSAPDSDIVGGADDLGYFIKRVTFKLHDTYPNPTRNIDKPPFEVSETGWGEFEIQIRITYVAESGEKATTLYHHLKLHPWSIAFSLPNASAVPPEPEIPSPENAAKLGPVHSWQYDEIVFTDPFQNFLTLLTTHPPTPLPKTSVNKKPIPFHSCNPASLEASLKGGVPEFTSAMEKDEADRLEEAKGKIIKEQEKWRGILIEREKELERLQKLLASKE
ncbi:yeats family-domain-containing protein [Suillus subaureus]|uniref:Protein AF-9 homolog n=1 Tax=Suillus subaureus TaxID=48587 RepID=A0A9P7EA47_9AGAM|nr:yeats family-domain-containing protein [Suillus subaureus]KAG1815744.1 yeats family-domain-containing protein [Suillus subaureus]